MARPKRGAARQAEQEAEQAAKKAKAGLAIGDQVPEDLPELETDESSNKEKTTVKIQDVVKESGIVLFAYAKCNTPICTKQAVGFQEKLSEIEGAGFKVFGLSPDKFKAQSNWKAKNELKYTLLCDPNFTVIPVLGFAKGPRSVNRSHMVIEKGGKIKDIRIDVKPEECVALALEAVKAVAAEAGPSTDAAPAEKTANGTEEPAPAAPPAAPQDGSAADAAAPAPEAAAEATKEEEATEAVPMEEDEPKDEKPPEEMPAHEAVPKPVSVPATAPDAAEPPKDEPVEDVAPPPVAEAAAPAEPEAVSEPPAPVAEPEVVPPVDAAPSTEAPPPPPAVEETPVPPPQEPPAAPAEPVNGLDVPAEKQPDATAPAEA